MSSREKGQEPCFVKQEVGRKVALQTGSQRREIKASFFIYIGTLVQFQPLESEWDEWPVPSSYKSMSSWGFSSAKSTKIIKCFLGSRKVGWTVCQSQGTVPLSEQVFDSTTQIYYLIFLEIRSLDQQECALKFSELLKDLSFFSSSLTDCLHSPHMAPPSIYQQGTQHLILRSDSLLWRFLWLDQSTGEFRMASFSASGSCLHLETTSAVWSYILTSCGPLHNKYLWNDYHKCTSSYLEKMSGGHYY